MLDRSALQSSLLPLSLCLLGAFGAVTACSGEPSNSKSKSAPKNDGVGPQSTKPEQVTAEGNEKITAAALRDRVGGIFGELPKEMVSEKTSITEAKVTLGRSLYYEKRLSKNHDISCESCHHLAKFGVDNEPTSPGHKGQLGGRNSPTVYNAALQFKQFWDGRAENVEEQAKGPVLNPVEMAMVSEETTVGVLKSIPGYVKLFEAAFPDQDISYDKMAEAIGAFERKLVTPSPFDAFLAGDDGALSDRALRGLDTFVSAGCVSCHSGPGIGGTMFQKLGLLKPFESKDLGREEVTKSEADRHMFKVPGLRNVAKTGPYLHDGSVKSLEAMVDIMVSHQTAKGSFTERERGDVVAFLGSLTGVLPNELIAMPDLPKSGPSTPKPDPS